MVREHRRIAEIRAPAREGLPQLPGAIALFGNQLRRSGCGAEGAVGHHRTVGHHERSCGRTVISRFAPPWVN